MSKLPSVRIDTERLVLRPMGSGDLDAFLELHSHPAVSEFLGPTTPELAAQRLELSERNWQERGHDLFAALDRESGRFLGRIGLRHWAQFNETEVGWALRRETWGHGFATEAARACVDWGFTILPLPYITSMIRPDNGRSRGVALRLGMRPMREDVLHDIPVNVWAVRRTEWLGEADRAAIEAREREEAVERLLIHLEGWARAQPDLVGVALVGSRGRGDASPESDVDLVVLSRDQSRYLDREDWAGELGGTLHASAHRGLLVEQRVRLRSGLDLDVGIGSRRWAATMPVDRGTARVVQEGWRIIHDPEGALVKLELAVRSAEQG